MDHSIPNFFLYGGGGGGGSGGGGGNGTNGGGGSQGQPMNAGDASGGGGGGGGPAGDMGGGGGGPGGLLPGSTSMGQPQPQPLSHDFLATQSMMGGGGGGMASNEAQQQALQFAGYPALMQQYFQQQQQQAHQQQQQQQQQQVQQQQQQVQQQMMGSTGLDPRFAGFSNGNFAGQGGAMMGMGSAGGAGMGLNMNMGSMGMGMGMVGAPMMSATNVSQGPPGTAAMGQAIGGYGLPGVGYVDNSRMMLSQGWGGAQVGYAGMMGAGGVPAASGGGGGPSMGGGAAAAPAAADVDQYAESGILGPWSATSAGLLGNMASGSNTEAKGKKLRKKPKDRPKRPLSAYNIFFKEERARILEKLPTATDDVKKEEDEGKEGEETAAVGEDDPKDKSSSKRTKRPHGKIGFESLAKVIGQRWQELSADQVEYYKKKAEVDMKRYKQEMEVYLGRRDHDGDKAGSKDEGEDNDSERRVSKKMKSDPGGFIE